MKIGFFGTRMDWISGHSRPAFELAGHLQDRGHKVRFLTSHLPLMRQQHHEAVARHREIEVGRAFASYFDLYRKGHILRDFLDDCDIVHEFSPYGLGILPRSHMPPTPTVISITNSLCVPLGSCLRAGVFSLQHGLQPRFLANAFLPQPVRKKLLARAHAIIAWTEFTYRQVVEVGIPERIVSHIPVGIDHTRFIVEAVSDKPGKPTFLYLGPVAPIQGTDILLQAFAQFHGEFPSSHLIIADRGPDVAADHRRHRRFKESCLALVHEAGLDEYVTWKGFVPEISLLLNSTDAVILPFRVALGYSQPSLALIETLIHGKPIISTLCGAVPEDITSGENGILVQPGDPGLLAEAMTRFATRPLARRSDEVRREAIRKHTWPTIVDAHLNVYEHVLSTAGT